MDFSEKWGVNVEEAVRLALIDLDTTEDNVVITVLEEPTKGFLGIGAKLAKVRVEKIKDSEKPEEIKPESIQVMVDDHKPEGKMAEKPQKVQETSEIEIPKTKKSVERPNR